jgi:hypothetical protein
VSNAAAICSHCSPELVLNAWVERPRQGASDSDDLGHFGPAQIFLAFKTTKIGSGDSQRTVIEEPGYILDALPGVSTKLGGGMAKDVEPGGRKPCLEVAAKPAVEGGASQASSLGGAR